VDSEHASGRTSFRRQEIKTENIRRDASGETLNAGKPATRKVMCNQRVELSPLTIIFRQAASSGDLTNR
jgi:hypothetical protein